MAARDATQLPLRTRRPDDSGRRSLSPTPHGGGRRRRRRSAPSQHEGFWKQAGALPPARFAALGARAPEPISRASSIAPSGGACARSVALAGPVVWAPMGGVRYPGGFPSGQRGQTVNLMALPSQVRILLRPPPRPSAAANALLGCGRRIWSLDWSLLVVGEGDSGRSKGWPIQRMAVSQGGRRYTVDGSTVDGSTVDGSTGRAKASASLRAIAADPVRIESQAAGTAARPNRPRAESAAARACAGVVQW